MPELDQLLDTLRRESLSEEELDRYATEWLALHPASAATRLFRLLTRKPAEKLLENGLLLLVRLAHRDDRWRRIIEASLSRNGRCPRPLVKPLRQGLARTADLGISRHTLSAPIFEPLPESESVIEGSPPVAFQRRSILARARAVLSTPTPTLRLGTADTNLDSLHKLIAKLAPLSSAQRLVLDVTGVEHLFITALAAIAAWSRHHDTKVELAGATPQTNDYLERIGFLDALRGGVIAAADWRNVGYAAALRQVSLSVDAEVLADDPTPPRWTPRFEQFMLRTRCKWRRSAGSTRSSSSLMR